MIEGWFVGIALFKFLIGGISFTSFKFVILGIRGNKGAS